MLDVPGSQIFFLDVIEKHDAECAMHRNICPFNMKAVAAPFSIFQGPLCLPTTPELSCSYTGQ